MNRRTKSKPLSIALRNIILTSAIISPSAMALNLNIWGVGHLSVDSFDDGDESSLYVASNSSRLAFEGDQELSDNLKVVFRYENGVDLTGQGGNDGNGGPGNQSGGLFTNTRDAWLGLSGIFGTIHMGRVAGLNQWVYDYNLFADQVGDLGNIWGGTGLAGRVSSSIEYITPEIGPMVIKAVYVPEENSPDSDIIVLKGDADISDIKIGLGYMSQGNGVGSNDHKATALTASYSFGAFGIGGGFQTETDIGGTDGADSDSITIGGTFDIDSGKIKAQFTSFSGSGNNNDASPTNNDTGTNFTTNNYGHGDAVTPVAGNDPSAFSVGLVYKFDTALSKSK